MRDLLDTEKIKQRLALALKPDRVSFTGRDSDLFPSIVHVNEPTIFVRDCGTHCTRTFDFAEKKWGIRLALNPEWLCLSLSREPIRLMSM